MSYIRTAERVSNSTRNLGCQWIRNPSRWSEFYNLVLEWRTQFYNDNSEAIYSLAGCHPYVADVEDENSNIHPAVQCNFLNIVQKVLPNLRFVKKMLPDASKEQPDFIAIRTATADATQTAERAPEIKLFNIELKGNWTLQQDVDLSLDDESLHLDHRSAVQQIYNYMVTSGTVYGVLSSYDTTWFTYRDADGGHFISGPIQFDAQDPTPLECIAFLCAQGLHVCPSPGRIRSTLARSETKKRRLNKENEKEGKDDDSNGGDHDNDSADGNGGDSSNQASLRFDLGDLLGAGRCKVFEERTFKMALKLVDAYKKPDLVKELHHEADMYRSLGKLQGVYIPKLVWSGTVEGIFEGIGISPICTVPSSLSSKQKQHLIDGLRAIHKFGFLHGDLKMQNILVNDNDTAFISDFGFSVPNANRELIKQEEEQFSKLISQF